MQVKGCDTTLYQPQVSTAVSAGKQIPAGQSYDMSLYHPHDRGLRLSGLETPADLFLVASTAKRPEL